MGKNILHTVEFTHNASTYFPTTSSLHPQRINHITLNIVTSTTKYQSLYPHRYFTHTSPFTHNIAISPSKHQSHHPQQRHFTHKTSITLPIKSTLHPPRINHFTLSVDSVHLRLERRELLAVHGAVESNGQIRGRFHGTDEDGLPLGAGRQKQRQRLWSVLGREDRSRGQDRGRSQDRGQSRDRGRFGTIWKGNWSCWSTERGLHGLGPELSIRQIQQGRIHDSISRA